MTGQQTIQVGAALERFPGAKYYARLSFFEYTPRGPLPRGATLTRFFHGLPEGAVVGLRAPSAALVSAAGPLVADPQQEEALAWTLDAADRLRARTVLLPTPARLTPGRRNRERLRTFAAALPRPDGRHYVWAPEGLWEEQDSARLAADLGLVRAFDPLQEELPEGPVAYARLRTLGGQTSFSDATLSDVVGTLSAPHLDAAFLAIESERSVQQAERATALLNG